MIVEFHFVALTAKRYGSYDVSFFHTLFDDHHY